MIEIFYFCIINVTLGGLSNFWLTFDRYCDKNRVSDIVK